MEMTVIDAADGVTHVALDGRFDIAGAQAIDARFTALAENSKALVVDLEKVSFIASLGVRTLMVSAKTSFATAPTWRSAAPTRTSRRCCDRPVLMKSSASIPILPRLPRQ